MLSLLANKEYNLKTIFQKFWGFMGRIPHVSDDRIRWKIAEIEHFPNTWSISARPLICLIHAALCRWNYPHSWPWRSYLTIAVTAGASKACISSPLCVSSQCSWVYNARLQDGTSDLSLLNVPSPKQLCTARWKCQTWVVLGQPLLPPKTGFLVGDLFCGPVFH